MSSPKNKSYTVDDIMDESTEMDASIQMFCICGYCRLKLIATRANLLPKFEKKSLDALAEGRFWSRKRVVSLGKIGKVRDEF